MTPYYTVTGNVTRSKPMLTWESKPPYSEQRQNALTNTEAKIVFNFPLFLRPRVDDDTTNEINIITSISIDTTGSSKYALSSRIAWGHYFYIRNDFWKLRTTWHLSDNYIEIVKLLYLTYHPDRDHKMAIMWDIFLRYLGQNAVCLFLASKGYDLPPHYCWVDPFLPLWPHHSPIPLTICCDIPLPYTYNWSELPEVVARLMECQEFLQQNALFLQTVAILWVRRVKETHYLLPRDTAACSKCEQSTCLCTWACFSWFLLHILWCYMTWWGM